MITQLEAAVSLLERKGEQYRSGTEGLLYALGYAHVDGQAAWQWYQASFDAMHPFAGVVLGQLLEAGAPSASVKSYFQRVVAGYRHLYDHCDPLGEGLPHAPNAREQVLNPSFLTALTWSNERLIQLGNQLGADVLEVIQWHELTIFSMNDRLWDEACGGYFAFDIKAKSLITHDFSKRFVPMAGEIPTQDQAECMLVKLHERLLVSDVSVFDIWLLYRGMLRYDFVDLAARLRKRILYLCQEYGFCKGFNLETGNPLASPKEQSPVVAALIIDLLQGLV